MAKARTSRPTPAATEGRSELEFIADKLVEKVWQGDESRRGIATQAASVALAAIQDHTAARYMETADEFDGPSLLNLWMNREAHASVALDKGDGETQSVDLVTTEPGPPTETADVARAWFNQPRFRQDAQQRRDVGEFLAKQEADGAEIVEHPDEWKDDL